MLNEEMCLDQHAGETLADGDRGGVGSIQAHPESANLKMGRQTDNFTGDNFSATSNMDTPNSDRSQSALQ